MQPKLVYSPLSVDGIRFSLYSNGDIFLETKIHEKRKVDTLIFADSGKTWIPKHKNFNSLCKQMVREGDFIEIEKELEKHRKLKSSIKASSFDVYNAIISGDMQLATEICQKIQKQNK